MILLPMAFGDGHLEACSSRDTEAKRRGNGSKSILAG